MSLPIAYYTYLWLRIDIEKYFPQCRGSIAFQVPQIKEPITYILAIFSIVALILGIIGTKKERSAWSVLAIVFGTTSLLIVLAIFGFALYVTQNAIDCIPDAY